MSGVLRAAVSDVVTSLRRRGRRDQLGRRFDAGCRCAGAYGGCGACWRAGARRSRRPRCTWSRFRHALLHPLHATEARGAVEIALAEDGGPGDSAVVLHGVEVDAPGRAELRWELLGFAERLPRDEGFDGVTAIFVVALVEGAVEGHRALQICGPLLVTEGAVGFDFGLVVVVELRVEHQVLRIDLDLVVVLVVAVPFRVDHDLDGVFGPQVWVLRVLLEAADDVGVGN